MRPPTPRDYWGVCSITSLSLVARSGTFAAPTAPRNCKKVHPIDHGPRNRLDYLFHPSNILLYWRSVCALRPEKGESMALWKFIKYDDLSEADKKDLKKVIQQEKAAIQKAFAELKKRKKKSPYLLLK